MDNKQFNEQRHNRKKQRYRFTLGFQQLLNYPILNLVWLLFIVGVVFLIIVEKKYIADMDVFPMFESIFSVCMTTIIIVFPIICAIGANYAQTECQFRYCGTAIPFLTVRSTAR